MPRKKRTVKAATSVTIVVNRVVIWDDNGEDDASYADSLNDMLTDLERQGFTYEVTHEEELKGARLKLALEGKTVI